MNFFWFSLHIYLKQYIKGMVILGSFIALCTVLILIIRYCVQHYAIDKESFKLGDLRHFVGHLIIGVTVLVVAVPEGLPLAVTLSLAYSVKKVVLIQFLIFR